MLCCLHCSASQVLMCRRFHRVRQIKSLGLLSGQARPMPQGQNKCSVISGAAAFPVAAAQERRREGTAAEEGDHSEDRHERDAEEVLCRTPAKGEPLNVCASQQWKYHRHMHKLGCI